MAYITIETNDHGGLRTLHERVSCDDLTNAMFCDRLVERIRWAVEDTSAGDEMVAVEQGFKEGDHVTVPDPDGPGTVRALFMAPVDPDDVPEDGHDLAWIRYSAGNREGTTHHLRYAQIAHTDAVGTTGGDLALAGAL